jgi:hypothetical protein
MRAGVVVMFELLAADNLTAAGRKHKPQNMLDSIPTLEQSTSRGRADCPGSPWLTISTSTSSPTKKWDELKTSHAADT